MLTTEIEASRYPLSPRIAMLKGIRAKLRGEEARSRTGTDERYAGGGRPVNGEFIFGR